MGRLAQFAQRKRLTLRPAEGESEIGGTRTHDHSIKSAVLYQLSYDLATRSAASRPLAGK
jgi:hypothetical protein